MRLRTPLILIPLLLASLGGAIAAPVAFVDGFDDAKRRLMAALDAKRRVETARAVEELAATGDPRAVRALLLVGTQDLTSPVYSAVLDGLAGQSSEPWVLELGEQLKKVRSDAGALLIVKTLGLIDSPATVPPLVEALQVPRPPILLAALRAARGKTDRALVEPLIGVLERVEADASTLWAECRITLQVLTGEAFVELEDWRNWWETRGPEWKPVAARGSEEKARTAVHRPAGDGIALPKIFGNEVASKRVVFVIDCSKSMEAVDPPAHVEEGSTGSKGVTRLKRAQTELIAAIGALRPEVRFNVIAFSKEVTPWSEEKLAKAGKGAKRRAASFVAAMKPNATTSSGAALLQAMAFPEVDTIYFLSDGSPTDRDSGDLVPIEPILEEVFAENRKKNITIHTLGFEGAKESFMRALADFSGGTYAPIR